MIQTDVPARIERVADALRRLGHAELAVELDEVLAALSKRTVAAEPAGGVLTTGEAAARLGIKSITTVKRWAMDGVLDGYRRGGRMMVSAASVERLLASPTVAAEKAREAGRDEAFAPFDFSDEEIPVSSPPGRRPWATTGG
jgi:excisionase family DNA binding protein